MRWEIDVEAVKVLLILLVLAPAPSAVGQPTPGVDTVEDELIVLLRPGPERPRATEVVAAVNALQAPIPGGRRGH